MRLSKTYNPADYESDIYDLWEKSGVFAPSDANKTYGIVMPPPNANAGLHMGYALVGALEDIAARFHRMKGEATLLLPGADHAGFESQVVYEKQLAKEGKSRFDFTREELYQQIWNFVAENRKKYEQQYRKIGLSCDWERYTFTLDNKIVSRAYETFKKMWDEGLVYRGERLVNYCTFHGTGFADVEVDHKDEEGHLWHVKYPLADGSGDITVATTRPETLLGDTAVAVHPKDKRYNKLIGKTVKLPLANREIPIIADEMVDKSFGSGAVKITPAHDPNDYEVGRSHGLPFITVIGFDGKLTDEAPEAYRGLSVEEGRTKVVKELEKQGVLVKTEPHSHNVGHCYKCGTIIQPLLKEQWFINMEPLAKKAIKALKNNEIKFHPDSKKKQLITYLEGLHDWNISRQIAWGIPVPAFQSVDNPDEWIFDTRTDQEIIKKDGKTYRRDPDVFDTWFSSSSWPYATLDYPDGKDFDRFYPLSLMETGGEILYPWVSRMIMLGLYVTDNIPFESVYIHGYVMAEDGSKMSKSVGNVVDPMPVIDEYGSDALRMGIVAGRAPAVNRGYDKAKIQGARNFCNKLWNVARYVEGRVGENYTREKPKPQTIADHWVLSKIQQGIDGITSDLDSYRFAEAYEKIYHLLWDDVADWYVEASKSELSTSVIVYALESILKLAHPYAPFVTETIWQTLGWTGETMLISERLPEAERHDSKKAKIFEDIRVIVTEVRTIVTAMQIRNTNLYYTDVSFLEEHGELISRLSGIEGVHEVEDGTGLHLTTTNYNCWLDIDHSRAERYMEKLRANQTELTKRLDNLQKRLDNKAYMRQAPKKLVDETREQTREVKEQLSNLDKELDRFQQASA